MTRPSRTTHSHAFAGCMQSGTHFPNGWGFGKCVQEFAFGVGCSFRLRALVENATRNLQSEWDAVSQRGRKRKLHPTPDVNSGTRFPDAKKATRRGLQLIYVRRYTQDKPRPNIRASVQAEAYKVYREFRTQRRPLNVAFVLRRTVEQETLYPAPPSGDRAVPATASCSDRRQHRTARFRLGRIYGERPPRSWLRYRYRQTRAAPLRESPDAQAS